MSLLKYVTAISVVIAFDALPPTVAAAQIPVSTTPFALFGDTELPPQPAQATGQIIWHDDRIQITGILIDNGGLKPPTPDPDDVIKDPCVQLYVAAFRNGVNRGGDRHFEVLAPCVAARMDNSISLPKETSGEDSRRIHVGLLVGYPLFDDLSDHPDRVMRAYSCRPTAVSCTEISFTEPS